MSIFTVYFQYLGSKRITLSAKCTLSAGKRTKHAQVRGAIVEAEVADRRYTFGKRAIYWLEEGKIPNGLNAIRIFCIDWEGFHMQIARRGRVQIAPRGFRCYVTRHKR